MRRLVLAGLAAALFGCATEAGPPGQTPPPQGGAQLMSAVGTPFLILLKAPLCALTVLVVAPIAAVSEVADPYSPEGHDYRQQLGSGIDQNCGAPWQVTP